MVFTSLAFIKFFIIVLIALWLLPKRNTRQLIILIASCYFYAYWNPVYLLLLATPSVIDYICSIQIEDSSNPKIRKAWLLVSIISNLALLGYFKYTNFFIENISFLLGIEIQHLDIILPVGISFYIFKTLSYTIDVYRGELKASRSLWQYAMFVTYFPELVAGPIVRASVFLPQMTRSLRFSWTRAYIGLQIILLGFTKKLLIADKLAIFVDEVFAHPIEYSSLTVIIAVLAYSLQIYCDFSGYSDIAIGVSKVIGYDLPENFNMPYLSTSITEFWRRWHITLSLWLRDYLYIPLGGNKKGRFRTYINLFIVMLLGGLWHGASWNFIFFGGLHGLALAIHKFWMEISPSTNKEKKVFWKVATTIFSWLATYVFVCFTFIIFRASDFPTSLIIIEKVLAINNEGVVWLYAPFFICVPFFVVGHFIGVLTARRVKEQGSRSKRIFPPRWLTPFYKSGNESFAIKPSSFSGIYVLLPNRVFFNAFLLTLWILIIYLFSPFGTNPFIYFQF